MKCLSFVKKFSFSLIAVLMLSSTASLFADYNREGIPDSSEIRKSLKERWFKAPLTDVRMNKAELRTNRIGETFQVRLEETESTFNIFVSPHAKMEVEVYTDKGKKTEFQDIYPGDSAGSWVLIRDKKTGEPLRIRYYFAQNSEVFVQFYPENKLAYGDFVIFNCYASRGIATGLPFEKFYSASFAEVKKWTEDKLPWKYNKIYPSDYENIRQMIGVIREKLPECQFVPDVCYDENGNSVYVTTGKPYMPLPEEQGKTLLGGPGFLKWISDGIIEPLTGGLLNRNRLLDETVSYKDVGLYGIVNQKTALSFTLDWTRNLATAVSSVRTHHHFKYEESGVDVTDEPFSAELTASGVKNVLPYIQDSGYSTENLRALLYILAVTEPDTFYLAAIRETDFREKEIKVFNECAVFFPYFDSEKKFRITVFQDCSEVDLDTFCNRFSKSTVNFVKVQGTKIFVPK